jgi:hypothetical protein
MKTALATRFSESIMEEVGKDPTSKAHAEEWGQFECYYDHEELVARLRKLCRGLPEGRKREIALFVIREAFEAFRSGAELETERIRDML